MENRSPVGILGLIIKIILGAAALYVAYLLFRYAAAKGDWAFIVGPIKNLLGAT